MELEEIICPECGSSNPAELTLCKNCGFNLGLVKRGDDEPALERVAIEKKDKRLVYELAEWERLRRENLLLISSIYTAVVMTFATIFFLIFAIRFFSVWPIRDNFRADSERMADALLKVQSLIQLDTTKGEFKEAIRELSAETFRYRSKYAESKYRSGVIYTQLSSSAEFYAMSNEAWDSELRASYGRVIVSALASSAGENVQKLWRSASASLKQALKHM